MATNPSILSTTAIVAVVLASTASTTTAAELLVGSAAVSITPDKPVALEGQLHVRIAERVANPVTATALALESRTGEKSAAQAILVSCDLAAIPKDVIQEVRNRVGRRSSGFDTRKIVINATHTHTAPVTRDGIYLLPSEGLIRPPAYIDFLADRLADVILLAWERRTPGLVGWGLGHAVVGQSRRAVYADGEARLYGRTDPPDFRGLEGYEDHGVEVLFFWNTDKKLVATAINIACPSQEVESDSAVNADFWHPVRERLRSQFGPDLHVLAWTSAAGDQSPHLMYRKDAEERMRKSRGLTRLDELARRVVNGWTEAYEGAKQDIRTDVELVHTVRQIALPERKVTRSEYIEAKSDVEKYAGDPKNFTRKVWNQMVVDRYDKQTDHTTYDMELHVIRLGDVAIASNDFELFADYGVQIRAKSRVLQTFLIQLAGPGGYLPTERAARGGGYSVTVHSVTVGPAGGQVLVNRTVEEINSLWPSK